MGGGYLPLSSCTTSALGRGTDLLLPGGGRIKTAEHLFAALRGWASIQSA
ncbi:hypothetical protein MASR2M17_13500 [Aminivibrio sp.]